MLLKIYNKNGLQEEVVCRTLEYIKLDGKIIYKKDANNNERKKD